jgi:L-fuconolactonase
MKIDRRQFIRRTTQAALAAGTLGSLSGTPTAASEDPQPKAASGLPAPLEIVDTHQHLWDLGRLRLPWLSGALNRNYVMKDYLEAAKGLNVVKTVYMEVAVDPKQLVDEAEYVIGLCERKDNPMVAAVIGGRPAADDFRQYITRYKDSPYIKGIRHILPGDRPGLWPESAFVRGIRLLGELGMSFDLCMPPQRLPDAVKLVDACPGTRFVLDHCGNADPQAFRRSASKDASGKQAPPSHEPDQWRRDMALLAKRQRVVCKISGIVARVDRENWKPDDLAPIINHCLEVFGPDRVIFASDWPVCTRGATLAQWVGALREIVRNRSGDEQRKLFCQNAVRFYGLPPLPS